MKVNIIWNISNMFDEYDAQKFHSIAEMTNIEKFKSKPYKTRGIVWARADRIKWNIHFCWWLKRWQRDFVCRHVSCQISLAPLVIVEYLSQRFTSNYVKIGTIRKDWNNLGRLLKQSKCAPNHTDATLNGRNYIESNKRISHNAIHSWAILAHKRRIME